MVWRISQIRCNPSGLPYFVPVTDTIQPSGVHAGGSEPPTQERCRALLAEMLQLVTPSITTSHLASPLSIIVPSQAIVPLSPHRMPLPPTFPAVPPVAFPWLVACCAMPCRPVRRSAVPCCAVQVGEERQDPNATCVAMLGRLSSKVIWMCCRVQHSTM